MRGRRFFHHRKGNSFLHRAKPSIKLIVFFLFAIVSFFLPVYPALILWIILILLSLVMLRFSPSEILTDLTPSFFYGAMLFLLTIIQNLITYFENPASDCFQNLTFFGIFIYIIKPSPEYIKLFARLSLSLQISSLLYRTTSTSGFSEGFRSIEGFFTKGKRFLLADNLSLALTFIPRLADFWSKINLAWKSRGGKKNIKRIKALTPLLFKESMKEAYVKALARENRK